MPGSEGTRPAPRLRADAWAELLLAPGYTELLTDRASGDPLAWPGYPELQESAPGDEAVRVYAGELRGHDCVLIAFDFAYIGGSAGAGVGERVSGAFTTAVQRELPVVTVTATGGSRMQEGMVALSQMPRMTVASRAHARAGLLHIGVASDPTTGGIYASVLSQADLLIAEPGAYIGFAGPRVMESLAGSAPTAELNRAEFAHEHGLVDAVVDRTDLSAWLAEALAATAPADPGSAAGSGAAAEPRRAGSAGPVGQAEPGDPATPAESAWAHVLAARSPERPRASDLLGHLEHAVHLRGDRAGGSDPGVLTVLARLAGQPVAVAGLDRRNVTPSGYRTIWRLFDLAAKLNIPLITLVDTPGADARPEADAAGQAHAISHTLSRLLDLPVPTVAVVVGEGGSGGAMALSATDRLLVQEHSIFSVIAPEGAAAILHRDASRAPEVAERLQLTATRLVELGVAHALCPDDPAGTWGSVTAALADLHGQPEVARLTDRRAHWSTVGADTVRHRP